MDNALERLRFDDTPWLPYPLIENSFFRVHRVDEENNVVVLNFKMPPGTITPKHGHHCIAMAYTLSGEWHYDNLSFEQGDMAFETKAEVHRPITTDKPAELLTILFGGPGNDKLLEDINEDGSTTVLRTRFFKAVERLTAAEYTKLDLHALLGTETAFA